MILQWENKVDNEDVVSAEDINAIANATIQLQEDFEKIKILETDQIYNPNSENAQSGIAIHGVLGDLPTESPGSEFINLIDHINKLISMVRSEYASTKQDKLISGENIKTINSKSILGSGNIEVQVETDQIYNPNSENAQSGIAVAEALSGYVVAEVGKGLSSNDFTNEDKEKLYSALQNEDIDQTYNPESTNGQSGTAVAQAIIEKEDKTNKTTSLSSSSTDAQYPSAKAVYDFAKDKQYELIEEITLTENAGLVNFSQEPNGTPYNFKSAIVEMTTRNSATNKNGYFRIYKDNVINSSNLIFISSIQYYLIGNKEAKLSIKIDKISNNQLLSVFVSGGNPSFDISTCQDTIKGIQFECSIGTPAGSTFKIWAVRA